MRFLEGHQGPVRCLAYSPDGSTLASGGDDGMVRLWTLVDDQARVPIRSLCHRVLGLSYSPDGSMLALGGLMNGPRGDPMFFDIFLRDSTTRAVVARSPNRYFSRRHEVSAGSFAIATAHCLAFAEDGRFLVALAGRYWSGGNVVLGDLSDRRYLNLTGFHPICSVACDPKGRLMAFGAADRLIITWGLRTRCFADWWESDDRSAGGSFAMAGGSLAHLQKADRRRPAPTRALAFSTDGMTLAAATGRDVDLWDPDRRRPLATLSGHEGEATGLSFHPDGRTLAASSLDGAVRTWDARDGRPLGRYDWGIGAVHCLAFAPDGMTMAAGGDSGLVIFDVDEAG